MDQTLIAVVVYALSVLVCTASDSPFKVDKVPKALANCERIYPAELKVYFNWPAFLSCVELNFRIGEPTGNIATCTIRLNSSADVLSNKTYEFSSDVVKNLKRGALVLNVTEELPSSYVVQYEVNHSCLYQIVELKKMQPPTKPPTVTYKAKFGALSALICTDEEPLGDHPSINWRWTFNGGEKLPDNVRSPKGHELELSKTNYEDVGKFVCHAEYNGKELSIMEFDVCIQYENANKPVPISCPEVVAARFGEDITIECNADFAIGKVTTSLVNGAWYRGANLNKEICEMWEGWIRNSSIDAEGSRIQCTMTSSIEKDEYYKIEPDTRKLHDNYSIKLTIKNLNASDFGIYRLEFGILNKLLNINITLQKDTTDESLATVTKISVAVCFFLLLMPVVLLCIWRKYDVMWFWKKHFGPYEKKLFPYTTYFAYYFDLEKMGKESMEQTKSLVEKLHSVVEKIGGTVYDEQREPNAHKLNTDNILQVQSECHRIILMISPGFITDDWSRMVTDFSLKEVVESGRKAIFITMPGTEDAISVLDKKTKVALVAAMKRNITIHWDGKIPLNGRFRRRLEYVLPKLRKRDFRAGKYVRARNGEYVNGFGCAA